MLGFVVWVALGGAPQVIPCTTRDAKALAAFNQARALSENNRDVEAGKLLEEAVRLDPNFAMAWAYRGYNQVGTRGLQDFQTALKLTAPLPEAERLYIELMYSKRQDDAAKVAKLVARLAVLAPDDWRVGFEQGDLAYNQRSFKKAIEGYRKALTTGHAAIAANNLGYALAMNDQLGEALVAFRRYADTAPDEPNPQDTLGEIHLAQGKFDKAEAAFKKAIGLSPGFFSGWHGLAFSRLFQGDQAGGLDALRQGRLSTSQSTDRMEMDVLTSWALLSLDRSEEALALLASLESESRAEKDDGQYGVAMAMLARSAFFTELGRPAEGQATAEAALKALSSMTLPRGMLVALRRRVLVRRLVAEARLGKLDDARRTLAALKEEAVTNFGASEVASGLHLTQGSIALAAGDLGAAAKEFAQCRLFGLSEYTYDFPTKPEDHYCLWQLSLVQDRLKDSAGAQRTRDQLLHTYSRDPLALYVRSRLLPRPAPPAP